MTSGIRGSTWTPRPETLDRLRIWRHGAANGIHRADIAARCGMTVTALDRMLCRARQHGHPDAIHHARAVARGAGTWHVTRRKARRGGTT